MLDVTADVRAAIWMGVGHDVIGDETRWVTYDELAAALGIAPDSARPSWLADGGPGSRGTTAAPSSPSPSSG